MATGNLIKVLSTSVKCTSLLRVTLPIRLSNRTTYILKRRVPIPIPRINANEEEYMRVNKDDPIYQEYLEVEDGRERVYPQVKLILIDIVEDIGQRGQIVECDQDTAYELVILKKALYPTPENIAKVRLLSESEIQRYSSLTAYKTMKLLRNKVLSVYMNMYEPWTMQPWHIRANFRLDGVQIADDDCIQLPENPINGPNLTWEGKDFVVFVKINNTEKVPVRCRLRHYTKIFSERIVLPPNHFCVPSEPIFPEQKELLDSIPLPEWIEEEKMS